MRDLLKDKSAIVTGAARGIGAAIAETLAEHGVKVMLVDQLDTTQTISDIHSRLPETILASKNVDVRDEKQVINCVNSTVELFGTIDIMVNNAGTCGRVGLDELTEELWQRDINTNLTGTFHFAKACVHPHMLNQGHGAIINIASIAGIMGGPSAAGDEGAKRSGAAYAASKGGIIALSKWIAKEYGPNGIRCNAVAPGPIASAMTESLNYDFSQQFLKHLGDPVDIAEGVAYLAAAPYVTGHTLNVCGGAAVA